MKKVLKVIFSIEFCFVLFLTVAFFDKGFTFIPESVDLTLIFFIVTFLYSVIKILLYPTLIKGSLTVMSIYSVFLLSVLIGYFNSDSIIYLSEKIIKIVVVLTWSLIGSFFIVRNKENFKKLMSGFLVISLMMTVGGLYEFTQAMLGGYYNGKLIVFNMSYLAVGRTVMLGLIFVICYRFFSDTKNIKYPLTSLIVIALMFGSVLVSGARMPVISIIFIVFLFSFKSIGKVKGELRIKKKALLLFALSTIGIIILAIATLTGKMSLVLTRLSLLFSGQDDSSFLRFERFDVAIKMIQDSPFMGKGLASFPLFYDGIDKKEYPHNIFLEIQAELGVLGSAALISLLIYGIYRGVIIYKRKYKKIDYLQLSLIGMFVFFFLNSNTTGDITDNRLLFAFIGLMAISPAIATESKELVDTAT